MKKVGVPVTFLASPSALSAATSFLIRSLSRSFSNRAISSFSVCAYFSRSSRPSALWFANSRSCISQNFPCSLAAIPACAASCANG